MMRGVQRSESSSVMSNHGSRKGGHNLQQRIIEMENEEEDTESEGEGGSRNL